VGGNVTIGQPNLTVSASTNQITSAGYTYDAVGSMTHDASAAYGYDGANRLIKINSTAAAYTYFGQSRIKKVVGSNTTRYIYSGMKPIAEYVGSTPTLSSEYIYAGSQLIATISGSTTTYHHPDHLSNRAESNSSGTRTRTYGHFPFGETWYETTPVDKWKFTSYERDSATGETGLDYANFRYYSSGLGRFMSPDFLSGHLQIPSSLNRYSYVLSDPVNLLDPLGLDCIIDGEIDGSVNTDTECAEAGGVWDDTAAAVGINVYACPPGATCTEGGPGDVGPGGVPVAIGTLHSGENCIQPTTVQKIGIAVQGTAAKFWGKTLLAGLGTSGGAGFGKGVGMYGSVSAQIAVSPNGNAAYVISWSAPAAVTGTGTYLWLTPSTKGAGILGGSQFGFSNATNPSDLASPAIDASFSGAAGLGIGADGSTDGTTWAVNVTLGFGLGGRGSAGAATHTTVIPICHN
jgi:RHS repeat-associated protein